MTEQLEVHITDGLVGQDPKDHREAPKKAPPKDPEKEPEEK